MIPQNVAEKESAEMRSGEQFSTSSNFSEPSNNIRKNVPQNVIEQFKYRKEADIEAVAEIERSSYEEEADIEVKVDITSSAEISSGKPICASSK